MQGDFFQLLKAQGYQFGAAGGSSADREFTTATTILAFKYRDGVLVAGDRLSCSKAPGSTSAIKRA